MYFLRSRWIRFRYFVKKAMECDNNLVRSGKLCHICSECKSFLLAFVGCPHYVTNCAQKFSMLR